MARNTKSGNLRKLWLNIHLWLGVALLVALIPLGVSGSLLVWHEPMERALYAQRFDVSETTPQLPPSAYVAAAEKAFEGRAQVTTVRLPREAGEPVTVIGRMSEPTPANGRPRQLTAWLDPGDGRIADVAEPANGVFAVLHRLHGTLLIPQVGRKVVGWLGWAMTVSAVTGLILWWPRNGAFVKGLRWRRTPMTMDNIHHMAGFWICIPLAVLSLTGVYISFPQTSRALFGVQQAQSGPPRPRTSPPPLERVTTSLDAAVAAASAKAPGAQVVSVTYPTRGKDPAWRVEMAKPGAERPQTFKVSDATGAASPDRGGPGGRDPTSRLMRQIHDGRDTGLLWQTIVFLGGVAPAVLGITGVVMWLRKRARKAALRPAAAVA